MITAALVCETLNIADWGGNRELEIRGVSSLKSPEPNSLTFANRWDPTIAEIAETAATTLFLAPASATAGSNVIPTTNPRLAYARAVEALLDRPSPVGVATTARIDPSAQLADDVSVGEFVVIEGNVSVGQGSVLDHHVVLKSGSHLGRDVKVGAHTVIGCVGFGFERDEEGIPYRVPHLGGVVVQDRVEIGSHVTVAAGTILPTSIEEDVKVDDAVFIAHNCHIGNGTYLIAGAILCGSVVVGPESWIAPGVVIKNQLEIGREAVVGLGAVVTKEVAPNSTVVGNPAKPIVRRE